MTVLRKKIFPTDRQRRPTAFSNGTMRPAALPVATWNEALEDYLTWSAGNRKPNTVKDAKSHLSLLRNWAEENHLALDAFKAKHLDRYLAERSAKRTADITRRQDAVWAKAFFKHAFSRDYIRSNPIYGYSIPKAKVAARYVPSAVEVAMLLKAVPDAWNVHLNPAIRYEFPAARDFYPARDLAIIAGIIATGARISEMMSLLLADWRPEKCEVTFRDTKNGEDRTLPISESWAATVTAYLRRRPKCDNPYLFVTADGGSFDAKGCPRPIPYTSWHSAFARYMKVAGLSGWSPHNLRHFAATHMAVDHGDLETAKAMLGHKDYKTTQVYVHNSAQNLQNAYAKCDPLKSVMVNTRSVKGRRKLL